MTPQTRAIVLAAVDSARADRIAREFLYAAEMRTGPVRENLKRLTAWRGDLAPTLAEGARFLAASDVGVALATTALECETHAGSLSPRRAEALRAIAAHLCVAVARMRAEYGHDAHDA